MLSNFLMIFQDLVSTATEPLLAGLGDSTETNILLPSIEKQRWKGLGYSPFHVGSLTNTVFFQFLGSLSLVSKIGMLFWRRLFIMVKCLPSGVKPASWAGHLTSSNFTSHTSGPEATFLMGRLPGDPSGVCRHVTGSQVVRSTTIAAAGRRFIRTEYRPLGWWIVAS